MKKISTIILILSLNFSYSQTKEETIDWIKSKLNIYSYNSLNKNSIDNLEINECYITIYYTSITNMGELKNIMKIPTDANKIFEWIEVPNRNVEIQVFKKKGKKMIPVSRIYNAENSFPIYIREGENNLKQRLLTAIRHLNEFCGTKVETF